MVYLDVENHSEIIDDASAVSYPKPYKLNLATVATIFGSASKSIN